MTTTKSAVSLAERDRTALIHPHRGPGSESVFLQRGRGCIVTDADGRDYLDCTGGGLWANLIGHGRAELSRAAAEAMERLGFFCSFFEFGNETSVALAEKLLRLAGGRLGKVVYTSGGSEGIEIALKTARLAFSNQGQDDRAWVLSRKLGYHGVGFGGSSATSWDWLGGVGPQLAKFHHLTTPWPYHEELYHGSDPTDYLVSELAATIDRIGGEQIAAFIGEPVMGVAGVLVPPPDYWPQVQALLKQHGILLILDEVVTGFGRLGSWFGAHHFGLDPDIIVTAKGMSSGYFPLGAILMTDEVGSAVSTGDHGYPLGYTYNGHPTGTAVGLANLDILEREQLPQRAKSVGEFLQGELAALSDLPVVGDVRGVGLMAAVEVVSDRTSRAPHPGVEDAAARLRRDFGVIARPGIGSNLILSPPLVITEEQIVRCVDALRAVLADMSLA
ncbi:aminotransferase class III-fold pyridoxal phosphate-dependent enzyme [Nocardioides hungaricus]